jgi:hypothetical protein
VLGCHGQHGFRQRHPGTAGIQAEARQAPGYKSNREAPRTSNTYLYKTLFALHFSCEWVQRSGPSPAPPHRSTERRAKRGSECCSARGGTPARPSPCTMRSRVAVWSAPCSHALYACSKQYNVGVARRQQYCTLQAGEVVELFERCYFWHQHHALHKAGQKSVYQGRQSTAQHSTAQHSTAQHSTFQIGSNASCTNSGLARPAASPLMRTMRFVLA